MAVKIRFDQNYNVQSPTIVLGTKSSNKIGRLPACDITFKRLMNAASELSFQIHKQDNGSVCEHWDKIEDFKTVWCKEWDLWFEIAVSTDETDETIKNVTGTTVCEAELSQTTVTAEINTETDIARDNYVVTVFYNPDKPEGSLLDRVLEKVPQFTVKHVDATIANIQRSFSFSDISIYDALQEISDEVNCLFVFGSGTNEYGKIERTISVYDLEQNCLACGYRGEFSGTCPKCGSGNIKMGYGIDTTILVSVENLADNITYSTNVDSVKNCFKLEGGDDLMTATIRNCNPNNSNYMWHISDKIKKNMSDKLVEKLELYDKDYDYYMNSHKNNLSSSLLSQYNSLIEKYTVYNSSLTAISNPVIGYSNLILSLYDTIDFTLYLDSSLMPSVEMQNTSAKLEAAKLTGSNLSPVAVSDVSIVSVSTASSTILSVAKILIDSRYQVKVNESSLNNTTWTGNFVVTNYSDEEDTCISSVVSIDLNDDYEQFIRQKINKILNDDNSTTMSYDIVDLFKLDQEEFDKEIKKYSLNSLNSFHESCQGCIDILIEQGIGDESSWSGSDPNLYDDLYLPYYNKLQSLEAEIKQRESEIKIITDLQDEIGQLCSMIQNNLEFESYLGEELWYELLLYRREDTYSNSNYISDGLNNSELIKRANEFIETARKEIYKSATLQHSITSSLKNLLVMEEFKPIADYFEVGNWIRTKIDGCIYVLRLIEYEISFNNLQNISVTFSDVKNVITEDSDTKNILDQSQSMATSYSAVKRQASQGNASAQYVNNWLNNSLAMSQVKIVNNSDTQDIIWDKHGFLCREYDETTGTYGLKQLKIIYNGLYLTDNGWKSSRAGIGTFAFYNPKTGQYEEKYGVIADTICSNLMLSKEVGIYNADSSIEIGENGIIITTENDAVSRNVFLIQKKDTDVTGNYIYTSQLYIDSEGNVVLGNGAKILWDGIEEPFSADFDSITNEVSTLSGNLSQTNQTVSNLSSNIYEINQTVSNLSGNLSQTNQTVSNLNTLTESNENDIVSLKNNVTQNANAITQLNERVTLLENEIALLKQQISS